MFSAVKPLMVAVICVFSAAFAPMARADVFGLVAAAMLGNFIMNDGNGNGSIRIRTNSEASSQLAHAFRAYSTSERRSMQFRLRDLGYYSSTVDGLWGPGTLSALRRYAANQGLPLNVNSASDVNTVLARLRTGSGASAGSTPSSRTFSTHPTSSAYATSRAADASLSRSDIKRVQLWLSAHGFDAGTPDGVFGSQSRQAAEAYLAQQHGLSLGTTSMGRLYDLLAEGVDGFPTVSSQTPQIPDKLQNFKDLSFAELSLALSRRALAQQVKPLSDPAQLETWIEHEFPIADYGPVGTLTNDLTRAFYAGTPREKEDAMRLLRRLIDVNVTDEPLQFILRDQVVLRPVNFVPDRGVPIHSASLGQNVFLPYDLRLVRISLQAIGADLEFYNTSDHDLGYLPLDRARSRAMEELLFQNSAEYRFDMLAFITLNRVEMLDPSLGKVRTTYEAEASFDGFALVVSELDQNDERQQEAPLYVWIERADAPRGGINIDPDRAYSTAPGISMISTAN